MRPVTQNSARYGGSRTDGFTLVEILVTAAIIGIVFVTLIESYRTGLRMLEQSEHMAVATNLAEQVHEVTLTLPLADPDEPLNWGLEADETPACPDDVDDLDGQTFSPPISSTGSVMSDLADYRQEVTVESVADTDFNTIVADGASNTARVSVRIAWREDEICRVSWIVVGE